MTQFKFLNLVIPLMFLVPSIKDPDKLISKQRLKEYKFLNQSK